MDTLQAIHSRRSVRSYLDKPVAAEEVEILLRAAMQGPTARNCQGWRFVVVDKKEILEAFAEAHPFAKMAAHAPLGIVVCSDIEASGVASAGYFPQDAGASIQNIMLAARAIGLGSVWCGIHPMEEREEAFIKILGLPGTVRPIGLVVLGYPKEELKAEDRFDPKKVHYNHW